MLPGLCIPAGLIAVGGVAGSTVGESMSLAETSSAGAVYASSVAESVSLADSSSGGSLSGSVSESVSLADSTDAVAWTGTFSQALNLDSTGWSGYNMRQVIAASLVSVNGSSQVRVTLEAASAAGCSIDDIYIGHAAASGDAYDFDGGQVRLFVSGSGSFSIGAGAQVVTDAANFAVDETKDLIFAVHFNATSSVRGNNSVTGATKWEKLGPSEASTSNVTGYTPLTSALRLVNKIEVHS